MNIIIPFLQQCLIAPDSTALVDANQSLNYAEFKVKIEKISAYLQDKEVNHQCIALVLDRGIEAASCLYAILMAGACYLPIDIKNPPSRINFIISDAQPRFIIGVGKAPDWLDEPDHWLDLSQFTSVSINGLSTIEKKPSDLAAILYTSGSTGAPKGVALSHQALSNFSTWATTSFQLTAEDRIASLAPFHFDLSIFDLFSSLAVGASVYFLPAKLTLSPSRLTHWLSDQSITSWYTVPSLLNFIALKGALETTPLPHLKRLLFAGEVFPTTHLITLTDLLPTTDFYNLYGPTETNVCCYWYVDRQRLNPDKAIPIGHAVAQAELSISPDTGELLVKSLNNFSGYWQQGELIPLTVEFYPTGDKVSLNSYGEYEYLGRLDRMLKCSGYRVEPAEIEQCINQLDAVLQCAVVGVSDITSGQRPVAVLILQENASLAEIIQPLRRQLAPYMLPCKFKVLECLPCLSNGKTDYQAIQRLFH